MQVHPANKHLLFYTHQQVKFRNFNYGKAVIILEILNPPILLRDCKSRRAGTSANPLI